MKLLIFVLVVSIGFAALCVLAAVALEKSSDPKDGPPATGRHPIYARSVRRETAGGAITNQALYWLDGTNEMPIVEFQKTP